MEFFHQPSSSSQFTFDDYDFSMPYEDFRNIRQYVKSKVGLLKGSAAQQETEPMPHFLDHAEIQSRRDMGLEEFRVHSPGRGSGLETNNIFDVLELAEIKELDDLKISVLQEALQFLRSVSLNGVNGHRVGTILVIGNIQDLKNRSTGEIPNPLKGHRRDRRSIFNGDFKNSLSQFSQFDGFTGMDWDGCVDFCGRLIEIPHDLGDVPEEILGHGARHKAGWTISRLLPDCISLVLSQDGEVLVIRGGKILKIITFMDGMGPFFAKKYPPPLEAYFERGGGVSGGDTGLANFSKDV